MGKFINDRDGRVSSDDPFEVHLFESDAPVFDSARRHAFQIADHSLRIFASMSFDRRYNDVRPLLFEEVGILKHLISLTDTGSSADVNT